MSVLVSDLDHIVVVAAVLEEGVAFCEKTLGVKMIKGGEHARVETHNYLLNLDESIYLEVIAINPAARTVDWPRWFGMDLPEARRRAEKGPYLATFVARTTDIVAAAKALPSLGPVRDMQRGDFQWQITIPDDGGMVEGGTVPTMIQWPAGVHPTWNMPLSGCRLERLEIAHPDTAHLRTLWSTIGLQPRRKLTIRDAEYDEAPRISAVFATPNGMRTIC